MPSARLTNGNNGVLDGPWVEHPTATSDQDGVRRTTTDFRPGKRLTIRQIIAGAGRKAARMAEQLRGREIRHGGDGSITDIVFGSSTTSFEDGTRRTVNLLLDGASVSTIFHEETHGYWKEALATGRITRDEAITFLRAVDNVLAHHKGRKGSKETNLRLLPDNDADITDVMLDEAIAELREAEILRTRKDGIVPEGLISRNFAAIARLTGDRTAGKFRSFFDAIRARFGLVLDRSNAIKRGLADGSINKADYEAFFGKLTGQSTGSPHLDPAKVAEFIGTDEEVSSTLADEPSTSDSEALIDEATAEARKKVATVDGESIKRAGRFWLSLHGEPGVARLPDLHGKTMEDLVKEANAVMPHLTAQPFGMIGDDHVTTIKDGVGTAYIFVSPSAVWVNTAGSGGADTYGSPGMHENRVKASMSPAVYQIAQAYAKNNGLKFIPDPAGVSTIATFRRWPQLLSSAIRSGDTSHIDGLEDVDGWKDGDHENNAGLLALHEYEYVRHFFPEIDGLHLSEDSSTIINDAGAPVPIRTLKNLLVGERHPKRLGIGETTLRRAIVTGQVAAEGRLEPQSETAGRLHRERRIHPGAIGNFVPDRGSSAEGIDPPKHPLDGISYSVGHSTPGGNHDVVHERRSKARKREGSKEQQELAEAESILERVRRRAASHMTVEDQKKQVARKMLLGDRLALAPEEQWILKSKYEILLIYSADGRLQKAVLGTKEESKIPNLKKGDIISHNHPGGRGPSDSDLRYALNHPDVTMRIVARNEHGRTEIFQIRAKKTIEETEINKIIRDYKRACDLGSDDHAARRNAMELIADEFQDILEVTTTIQ